MGKVLSTFPNGFPGAISRSVDNIVISMANGADADILFGAPLFFVPGQNACEPFSESSEAENFLGFSARAAVKTPETYGESEAVFTSGDPVDVLVRGSVVVSFAHGVDPGAAVYIRKADGALVTNPGAAGTTLLLPNVTVRTASDADNRAEVVITKRNLI